MAGGTCVDHTVGVSAYLQWLGRDEQSATKIILRSGSNAVKLGPVGPMRYFRASRRVLLVTVVPLS